MKIEILKEITPNLVEVDEWKFYSFDLGQSPQGKRQPPIWFSPSYVNDQTRHENI
ncbi:MAG: hypothetical protein ABIN73_09730 [candidate division WOR-3 bacterium]